MSEDKGIDPKPKDRMTSDPAEVIIAGKEPVLHYSIRTGIFKKVNELISYLRSEYLSNKSNRLYATIVICYSKKNRLY
jgi:hypothetical protein